MQSAIAADITVHQLQIYQMTYSVIVRVDNYSIKVSYAQFI